MFLSSKVPVSPPANLSDPCTTETQVSVSGQSIGGTYVYSTTTNEHISRANAEDYCHTIGGFLPNLYNAALRDSLTDAMLTLDFGNLMSIVSFYEGTKINIF